MMNQNSNPNVSPDSYFGCNVFNEKVMRDRLPKKVYEAVMCTRRMGTPLPRDAADVVANAMKDWAVEMGCTHFTHWFQPMTGITAEKHDAFLTPLPGGNVILDMTGKELIKGESDASSFPSGGLRATFEARGYTAWDPTSDAFIKDRTLCIPTGFVSYTGEVLDKKTPLLRSMEAVSQATVRMLRLFGNTKVQRVVTNVGPEQEYFLIDKSSYDAREDLILTGRTLFGAMPPKGEEMDDHYFGNLTQRVSDFMRELDVELWKLGIYAKTEHNEVAPAQHELAPVYTTSNIAADHNQLTMELMKKIALKHDLVCLLHEKPFAGISGSGKHNNWSISTDDGQNLLDPGETPQDNLQFLLVLCAFLKGVREYAPLIRIASASAGNDCRLGGNEAPPTVISVFIGDDLQMVLDAIEQGKALDDFGKVRFNLGVNAMPQFRKDTTDRNRTSPMAFTGNKFEFRMLGSADSISCFNFVMNTIFAHEITEFCEELEKADDFQTALHELIVRSIRENKDIIFNGNGYGDEWFKECQRRNLPNYPSTVESLEQYDRPEFVALFEEMNVLNKSEISSRKEILLDNYSKTVFIEAKTMLDIARKKILPVCISYTKQLCDAIITKQNISPMLNISSAVEDVLASQISDLTASLYDSIEDLRECLSDVSRIASSLEKAKTYRTSVIPAMSRLRTTADALEVLIPQEQWPFPAYSEILYNI
ncbi:MAG: glutamine synthetase III [Oscillospiraceae bacterium]|nr:glutamine synthetase III [Oscillospiraceae bacterium]